MYVKGKKNGKTKTYFLSKKIQSKGTFRDGYLVDTFIEFYESGINKYEKIFGGDSVAGIIKWFSPNGTLSGIGIQDFNGDGYYHSKLDSLGYKIIEEGRSFSPDIRSNRKLDSIQVNELVTFYIPSLYISEYKTTLSIGKGYKELEPVNANKQIIEYRTSFNQPGTQELIVIGVTRNNRNIVIFRDTTILDINVIQ